MMNLLRSVAVSAICFGVACSTPKVADKPSKDQATAPAPKPGLAEKRADEIIEDLKKRMDAQDGIQQQARDHVPVVVEVSPKGSRTYPSASQRYSSMTGAEPPSAGNSAEADYWRQEFSVAAARLQSCQQQLEQARQRMTEAASQANSPNSVVRRMGQDAYQRAQQDFSQAQNDVYQAQSAVDAARSAAIRAGVPVTFLR